jgi:hypothetical protein
MPTNPLSKKNDKIVTGKPLDDEEARLAAMEEELPDPPDIDDLDVDDDDE